MKKKSGLIIFLTVFIVILIIIIIGTLIMYTINPVKLQENLDMAINKLQDYIVEVNGGSKPTDDNLTLPEKEELTEAQRYYYYQQLSETGKKIYITIENNIENLKNGMDNIPLPPSLNETAKSNGKELIAQEFQNAWDAFVTDKSEYFYLDSSKVCLVTKMTTKGSITDYEFFIGKGENKTYFIDEFTSKEEVESAIQEIEEAKQTILQNANGSNFDKILYIHDWIIDNNKYDSTNKSNVSNIYGSIVNKSSICEGYARAFKYLLDELDIPCILVSGTAVDENGKTERHAWNYVFINNNWYAIDTTWDDPIIIGNGKVTNSIRYKYFLKGADTMNKDHIPSGQVTKNGLKFEYPELSTTDLNY